MVSPFRLADSVSSLANGARGLHRRASNSLAGQDFNRRAYDQAQRGPYTYADEDLESEEGDYGAEAWSRLLRVERDGEDDDDAAGFAVKDTPGRLQQLTHKLSQKGLEKASHAAGLSAEYVRHALKFAATETARDIGWLATCRTTADMILALKTRFPVLEDIQRAYEAGFEAGRRGSPTSYRPQARSPGLPRPRAVHMPSDLRSRATTGDRDVRDIRADPALYAGRRIYDPSMHGGLEEVSADPDDVYSDDELDEGDRVPTDRTAPSHNKTSSTRERRGGRDMTDENDDDDDDEDWMEDVPIDEDGDEIEDRGVLGPAARHLLEIGDQGEEYLRRRRVPDRRKQ